MINLGRKQQEIEKKSKPVYVGPERGDPISWSSNHLHSGNTLYSIWIRDNENGYNRNI
jgi:hypothetical protein